MKTRQPIRLLFLTLVVFAGLLQPNAVQAQSKYVLKYRPVADSLSEVYGIPAAVILAVAIVESGSGTSRNAKLLNNHFGIVGKNNLLKTKGIKSRYKQYKSIEASYVDFCKVVSRKRFYPKMKGSRDKLAWVDAISKAGYSEIPLEWKKRVSDTIRKNKL